MDRPEIETYFTQVYDGTINSCEKIKLASEMILNQLISPGEFHFDLDIANQHIEFMERFCKVPSGKIGVPLKFYPFQKAKFQAIFGFVDDNDLRQYNEVLTIEGRKNGKTTECAAIELDMLINDMEGAPQIYNIATQLKQALLGFNAAHKMVQMSPQLKAVIHKRQSDLYFPTNMGYIQALASNTSSLDGLDIHAAIIDELSAIKNRDVYDLIKQATSAREQPLIFCISTNGFFRNGIFDTQYSYASQVLKGEIKDKRFLPLIYELDKIEEWDKEDCWIKANPGLGTVKSYEYLVDMVAKAKNDPATKPTVLVKEFDMKQTSDTAFLKWEELDNEATWDIPFDYGIGGFDAADTTDLNAAHAIYMRPNDETIYVESMYWLPDEVIRQWENQGKRQGRDNAPYKQWIDEGWMRTVPGNRVDKKIFIEWYKELKEQGKYMRLIGYDSWHVDDSNVREFKTEFGRNSMIIVRQGAMSTSQPLKDMKADLQAKRINYGNNPVTKWCLQNSEVRVDVNANIQLVKNADPRMRVDGTAALICAYKVLKDNLKTYVNLNKEKQDGID